jgi:hypothetical protein
MVTLTFASWNQIGEWLRRLRVFRRATRAENRCCRGHSDLRACGVTQDPFDHATDETGGRQESVIRTLRSPFLLTD